MYRKMTAPNFFLNILETNKWLCLRSVGLFQLSKLNSTVSPWE
jgi:hypothetical protein